MLLYFVRGLQFIGFSMTICRAQIWQSAKIRSSKKVKEEGEGEALTKERINEKWFCLPIMPSVSHGKEQTERKKKRKERMTRKQLRKIDTLARSPHNSKWKSFQGGELCKERNVGEVKPQRQVICGLWWKEGVTIFLSGKPFTSSPSLFQNPSG